MAAAYHLQIVSLDGLVYDGDAVCLSVRGQDGNLSVLAGHTNFCTAIGMGEARVVLADGTERTAACIGGMLSVMDGAARLIATTWEWKEDIDVGRAEAAKKEAEERLAQNDLSEREYRIAKAKLMRALVRIDAGQG